MVKHSRLFCCGRTDIAAAKAVTYLLKNLTGYVQLEPDAPFARSSMTGQKRSRNKSRLQQTLLIDF